MQEGLTMYVWFGTRRGISAIDFEQAVAFVAVAESEQAARLLFTEGGYPLGPGTEDPRVWMDPHRSKVTELGEATGDRSERIVHVEHHHG